MFGIGWDEMTLIGVLGVLLFDEKRAGAAWKWWRATRAKMINFKSDFEQTITDQVHETLQLKPLAESNAPTLNLRKQARFRLENADLGDLEIRSKQICEHLRSLESYQEAQIIAAYMPMSKEVQIGTLLTEILQSGKELYLPKVNTEDLSTTLYKISDLHTDLELGAFNILEPKTHLPQLKPESLDLILVPGLVFGNAGERMGRGKGYYDRLLATLPSVRKTAIAFEMQVFNTYIPQNLHDIPMDELVTETGVRSFTPRGKNEHQSDPSP